jgi:polyphenol oxidase
MLVNSTVIDGNMRLAGGSEAHENIVRFWAKHNIDRNKVVSAGLDNGSRVAVVGKEDGGKIIKMTDALITTKKDLYLAITVADCLPIRLHTPNRVVALIHAGWRGLRQEIIKNTILKIENECGVESGELVAEIGPHICARHYPVGEEVGELFSQYSAYKEGKLDLRKVAESQLVNLGVAKVSCEPRCTFESPELFSARRDGQENLRVMLVVAHAVFRS